jgi:hypothetical protein
VEEAQMKKKIELDFEAPTKIRGFFLFLHMLWPHKYYQENHGKRDTISMLGTIG